MRGKILFISIFLLSASVEAQTLKLGFRYEPALVFLEADNTHSLNLTPYSIYLTTLIQAADNLVFEIRPGFFLGDDRYAGFEIGGYARYNVISGFYLTAGLNSHSNSGLMISHGAGFDKNILLTCLGIGFQKNSKLGFDISYYWTADKDIGDSWYWTDKGASPKIITRLNGVLKAGFSLAWDIF